MHRIKAQIYGNLGDILVALAEFYLGLLYAFAVHVVDNRSSVGFAESVAKGSFVGVKKETQFIQRYILAVIRFNITMYLLHLLGIGKRFLGGLIIIKAPYKVYQKHFKPYFEHLVGAKGIIFLLFHILNVWHVVGRFKNVSALLYHLGEHLHKVG